MNLSDCMAEISEGQWGIWFPKCCHCFFTYDVRWRKIPTFIKLFLYWSDREKQPRHLLEYIEKLHNNTGLGNIKDVTFNQTGTMDLKMWFYRISRVYCFCSLIHTSEWRQSLLPQLWFPIVPYMALKYIAVQYEIGRDSLCKCLSIVRAEVCVCTPFQVVKSLSSHFVPLQC